MLGWIRGLFGRRAAPHARAEAPVPRPTIDADVEAVAPARPPCAVAAEIVDDAARKVVIHFHEHHPGPGSFPGTAARIVDIVQEPDVDLNQLVRVVGQDAAIAAKLLQVASSALYARGEEVQGVREAVLKLGLREVAEIALGVAGRSLFETESRAEYGLFPEVWDAAFHESMTLAFSASWLSLFANLGRSDQSFLAGMLHDIGRPVALRSLAALLLAGRLDNVVLGAIPEIVDRVHVEIGASLTSTWSLPEYVRIAAAQHHDAEVAGEPGLADVHVVRVLDGVKALRDGTITEATRLTLKQSAAALRIDHRMMRVASRQFAELAARVTELFGVADPVRRQASAQPPPAMHIVDSSAENCSSGIASSR